MLFSIYLIVFWSTLYYLPYPKYPEKGMKCKLQLNKKYNKGWEMQATDEQKNTIKGKKCKLQVNKKIVEIGIEYTVVMVV